MRGRLLAELLCAGRAVSPDVQPAQGISTYVWFIHLVYCHMLCNRLEKLHGRLI